MARPKCGCKDRAQSQPTLAGIEAVDEADNRWFGDMLILQVLADSEHVNDQEREVLTRWMAGSVVPSGVPTPPPAPQAVQGAPNDEGQGAICQPEGLMFDAQGRPRERYVRVAFGGHSCVVTPQEAAQIGTDLIADRYVFKDVYLSKEEFDGLPEFNGF